MPDFKPLRGNLHIFDSDEESNQINFDFAAKCPDPETCAMIIDIKQVRDHFLLIYIKPEHPGREDSYIVARSCPAKGEAGEKVGAQTDLEEKCHKCPSLAAAHTVFNEFINYVVKAARQGMKQAGLHRADIAIDRVVVTGNPEIGITVNWPENAADA